MKKNEPNLLMMIRAPFLSSILSPLFFGTLLSVHINSEFQVLGFILVIIMGIALHAATNVYNDIYDTKQGTDRVNIHRNEFSGGSGTIVNFPNLENKMYWIARISLIIALFATIGLMLIVDKSLWIILWILYILSAFFSKYYTAAPFKLASRGIGEISVWFAFGPMAVLVAAVSQNIGFHTNILFAMPITGLSTLSILLIGQLIDQKADKETGKWGVAVRRGTKFTASLYLFIQLILMLNVIILAFVLESGIAILIALIPYLMILPKIWNISKVNHDHPDNLKEAAGLNVKLHLLFSLFLLIGMAVSIAI
jgi:1,4-dihydroxy-2-naphthoate octaprenyltransferase